MKRTKVQEQERDEALEALRKLLPPGSKVYTICKHVARSGMSRRISLVMVDPEDRTIQDISWYVGRILGYRRDGRDGGLTVGGCGMDMGYHVVHSLSYALHGMESVGPDAVEAAAKGRAFGPNEKQYRAGYSLRHEWL